MRIKRYDLKMSFPPYLRGFFCQKIRRFSTMEKLENMMKKNCFHEKKLFSSFQSFHYNEKNWEGAKHAGDSRPSCVSMNLNLIEMHGETGKLPAT